jgi:predicted AAA+ superfamily ATPase
MAAPANQESLPGIQHPALASAIARMNPWWEGKPHLPLPPTRRHLVGQIRRRLDAKLAPIIVVRGPRQIGKSTAQMQVLDDLLKDGVEPHRIFRLQFDDIEAIGTLGKDPILRLVDWYERAVLRASINEVAGSGGKVYFFFDEVQNLPGWDVQLKFLVDHTAVQVVVTGSSALRIEQGRDSLAGRINTIEVGTLSLTEIAAFRGIALGEPLVVEDDLERVADFEFWRAVKDIGRTRGAVRDEAFKAFANRGGYPLVHQNATAPWSMIAQQLNETVIKRVIQHDLRIGDRGRKRDPTLLQELFRIACRYAGQAPNYKTLTDEAKLILNANVGNERVRHYMKFLADTLLLRLVEPLEIRIKKKRGAAKVCLADHGLRMSWLQERIPLDPTELAAQPQLATVAGYLAESIVGAFLCTIHGLDVAWLPERKNEPEVDFILTVGTKRIPIEVKYQRSPDPVRDCRGLHAFMAKKENNADFGVLITQRDGNHLDDPRIVSLPLASVLMCG